MIDPTILEEIEASLNERASTVRERTPEAGYVLSDQELAELHEHGMIWIQDSGKTTALMTMEYKARLQARLEGTP